MIDDLYIKVNPNPPDIPDSINGKWFVIELPKVPWWRLLWAKVYVRWCHFRGNPVVSAWDMPKGESNG